MTTGDMTTGDVTTGNVTTDDRTTGDMTTGDMTTCDMTTGDRSTTMHEQAFKWALALIGKPKVKVMNNRQDGTYLVAKRNISRGEPVAIYWGSIISSDESYQRWKDRKSDAEYCRWARYLRGLDDSSNLVDGSLYFRQKPKPTLNLAGVLVTVVFISIGTSIFNGKIPRGYIIVQ